MLRQPEPVFLNFYGAQESIPRNESASLCSLAGRYDNSIPTRFLAPIECLKIPALGPMDQIPIKTPNPKCRLFLKIDHYQQRYLAAGVYLSEAPDSLPPTVTHCMNTYRCTYSHREVGGGGGK
jgi:hypothetical protein